jgi:hypothetical protein
MRETYQNILFAIIIIFLIVLAVLFFNQQKTINQYSSIIKNQNSITQVGKNEVKAVNVDQIDRDKKSSEASVKSIGGRVISVSGSVLTIEADMPDWQKMKEPKGASESDLTYKKTFIVTVDDKTQFMANKLDSIKAGDAIEVVSKELVYQTDKLTAVFVVSPSALPAS